jgi:tetratricopeptide (TPR) repeat protein
MRAPQLSLLLLLVGCFALATQVGPRFDQLSNPREKDLLTSTLGESRRLFANQFFVRSDVYFHSGYYPTIFDQPKAKKENHLADHAGGKEAEHEEHEHGEHCNHGEEESFLGKPKDPMDAFTRHFFVSQHTHLTEKGTNAPREILPWVKLAVQLDPHKVESYTVGAYWLRQLNKNDEAEQFLREGLRQNPQSYEIALELGRGYFGQRDYVRARNVLEMAITRWREQENHKPADQRNAFAAAQILNYLARVEDRTSNRERAISWLSILKKLSPHPDEVDKRIEEVRAGKPLEGQ